MAKDPITRPSSSSLNARGQEIPDGRPLETPVPMRMPKSTVELIRDMVRREMSAAAEQQGFETFEEADDFDVDDDPPDPRTVYEMVFDPPPPPDPSPSPAEAEAGIKPPVPPQPSEKEALPPTSGPSEPPLVKP